MAYGFFFFLFLYLHHAHKEHVKKLCTQLQKSDKGSCDFSTLSQYNFKTITFNSAVIVVLLQLLLSCTRDSYHTHRQYICCYTAVQLMQWYIYKRAWLKGFSQKTKSKTSVQHQCEHGISFLNLLFSKITNFLIFTLRPYSGTTKSSVNPQRFLIVFANAELHYI